MGNVAVTSRYTVRCVAVTVSSVRGPLTCMVKADSFFLLMVLSSMVSGTEKLMSLLKHKHAMTASGHRGSTSSVLKAPADRMPSAYQSTMPSDTALNRSSESGSMGRRWLQSGSFSREELM